MQIRKTCGLAATDNLYADIPQQQPTARRRQDRLQKGAMTFSRRHDGGETAGETDADGGAGCWPLDPCRDSSGPVGDDVARRGFSTRDETFLSPDHQHPILGEQLSTNTIL